MNLKSKKNTLHVARLLVLALLLQLTGSHLLLAGTRGFRDETVRGKVSEENGQALPGVSVVLKGTSGIGTITDANGNFAIDVPGSSAVLKFSFIGYIADSVQVNGKSVINVVLRRDIQVLNELVVVGYGAQLKSDVTGAISSVGEKDFNRGSIVSAEQLIQGKMSGVNVTTSS